MSYEYDNYGEAMLSRPAPRCSRPDCEAPQGEATFLWDATRGRWYPRCNHCLKRLRKSESHRDRRAYSANYYRLNRERILNRTKAYHATPAAKMKRHQRAEARRAKS